MINQNNLTIFFYDNPISRAYLLILDKLNFNRVQIFYISRNYLFFDKINIYTNFAKNNSIALKLLKKFNLDLFCNEIEDYFNFDNLFIKNMYQCDKIFSFKNIKFIYETDVNSSILKNYAKSINSKYILNTTNKILRDILDIKKKFIHIHPGYLPNIRGADGSLNSIREKNEIGCSSFFMNKNIDEGDIIYRKKFKLPKFKKLKISKFSDLELYQIWYSFFDPLLRARILNDMIKEKNFETISQKKNDGNYYTFIKKNEIKEILKEVIL